VRQHGNESSRPEDASTDKAFKVTSSEKHNFVPLAVPDLRGNELKYLTECVEDNWISSAGPHVVALEEKMAEISNCRFGVATANGTASIHLALLSAGIEPGDYVAVSDWTFAASANAIIHAGAVPYFIGTDSDTWTMCPDLLDQAMAKEKQRGIAAVLAVHVLGHPVDMDRLAEVCAKYDVPIIEDAAGAIGATYKNKPVGSLGLAGTFSFNGNKTVTAGGGGMIVTDDESLAKLAKHLSTQARPGSDYIHDAVGFNYRMTNINAALGLAQLERLQEMVNTKRGIAQTYNSAFGRLGGITLMPEASWAKSSCWLYSIRLESAEAATELAAVCNKRNIGARIFWHNLSSQSPYNTYPTQPNSSEDMLSGRVVSLPCSSSLTKVDQAYVIDVVTTWLKSSSGLASNSRHLQVQI
jgi:perosamine synthetase